MIDKQRFYEFLFFDKELILEIIHLDATEIPECIEAIAQNIEDVDFDRLARNACKIKGILNAVCDPVSTGLARQLEHLARGKLELENRTMDDEIPQLFSELKTSTELLLDELRLIKQELISG